MKSTDLTGMTFGRLKVVKEGEIYVSPKGARSRTWVCECECGNKILVSTSHLKSGHTKSCGCLRHEGGKEVRDLTGQRFGRLIAIREDGRTKQGQAKWLCQCDCGNIKSIASASLTGGLTKSCGCYNSELRTNLNLKHGDAFRHNKARLYEVWCAMIKRCENPNDDHFYCYGGRGVSVCADWHKYENFKAWAYANGYDDSAGRGQCTIDRIDNNKGYEPGNCRWVDMRAQGKNTRKAKMLTIQGKTKPLTQWAEEKNIRPGTIHSRLRNGWAVEEAVMTAVMKGGNQYANYRNHSL